MTDRDAHDAGYDAYCAGVDIADNPHHKETKERQSWETGWKESAREDHFSHQAEPRPDAGRVLPKSVVACAVVGGVYGASLGSVIATNTTATIPIGVATGVLAVIGGLFAARIGRLVGVVRRVRFARVVLGTVAAIVSAVVGGFPVVLAFALPWSAVGAIVGWLVGRYRARSWRRTIAQALGALLGGCVGTIILSMQQDQTAARLGLLLGMGIGIVVGSLAPLMFWWCLDRVFERAVEEQWSRMQRRNG